LFWDKLDEGLVRFEELISEARWFDVVRQSDEKVIRGLYLSGLRIS
jgi:hypothetical protein